MGCGSGPNPVSSNSTLKTAEMLGKGKGVYIIFKSMASDQIDLGFKSPSSPTS